MHYGENKGFSCKANIDAGRLLQGVINGQGDGCLTLPLPARSFPQVTLPLSICFEFLHWVLKQEVSLGEGESSICRTESVHLSPLQVPHKLSFSHILTLHQQIKVWEYMLAEVACSSALNPVNLVVPQSI